MNPLAQSIAVGVTGKGENTDALRFAAREARRAGRDVVLVHAVHPLLPPPPPSILLTDDSWSDVGRAIVREVRQEFDSVTGGDVPATTIIRHGTPATVFSELSGEFSLIVLQHRDLSRLHRIFTGSTVAAVAAHARCPVVSVPGAGSSLRSPGTVTVGLREDGGPREVIEFAFQEAALHNCSVRLVHGWRLAPTYDGVLRSDRAWQDMVKAALESAAQELAAKYPDIATEVDFCHEFAADALVARSQQSDLLVLGRHDRHAPLPTTIGALTRAVVQHASCPVMVVPAVSRH